MFLKRIRQKNGREKLCVYESYRDGRRTRQRTVRALGYVDELAREHDDPVAWARSVVEGMNAERDAERQSVPVEIHPMQLVDKRSANRRNAGASPRRSPSTPAWGWRPCCATTPAGAPSSTT